MSIFRMSVDERLRLIENVPSYRKEVEARLTPLEYLRPDKPAVFISVGGGELGDLAMTAAKRYFGGSVGGLKTVAFDRYEGFPAQDAADQYECFDMMNGELLEKAIRKHVPDPSMHHAIYLEIEKINTYGAFKLGMEHGYRVMSTPYGPLICMDRHATKLMFNKLGLEMVEWAYASSDEDVQRIAGDFGLPVIVKPVMTSSGHGTSIVRSKEGLEEAYSHAREHARGIGDEVIVEKYLPELKTDGVEVTQIVVRHFDENGRIVNSFLPPVEHQRPAATYHESWLPPTISETARRRCMESAGKISDFIGGLGVYAVEQFVLGDRVFNNEVANRPHDTGMITRWMTNMDEGGLQVISTLGLQVNRSYFEVSRKGVYGVAHVILAPDNIKGEVKVAYWDPSRIANFISKIAVGDVWYFGKPTAYAGRRMGLAVAFHENLKDARRMAEAVAHFAEKCITYEGV
ncbi:MAG: ATP-grasp domain-containing protein [Thermoproteota archaeon]